MNQVDRWNGRGWLSVVAVLVIALAMPAWAQLPHRQNPQAMMANQLRLLMFDALAGESDAPTPDQLTQAQILLDMALSLVSDDPDLWRAQLELAGWRRDLQRQQAALKRLVALEPSNDAAQLQLILQGLESKQTLDQRLKILGRILDAGASRSLSPPLRSRLASYAASAAREMGDMDLFARRLAQAVRLDESNSEAAALMYELALQKEQAPLHQGAALIRWVEAAPANAAARFELGRMLLEQAVFHEAAQQFEMSVALASGPPDPTQVRLWVTSMAMAGQPEAALQVLRQVEQAMAGDGGGSQQTAYDDIAVDTAGLPVELELTRAALRSVTPAAEAADLNKEFDHLQRSLRELAEDGDSAARRELAIATAIFGHELDTAARLAEQADDDALDPDTRHLVQGWVALRYGRDAEGRELLTPLAERDDLAALGLALLEDDDETRASMLETVRHRDPTGVAGLLAVLNLQKTDHTISPTRVGSSLRDVMGRSPGRLLHTDLAYSPWLSLRLRVDPMRAGYLEPLRATAVLHNLSGGPLSLADGDTVPTRMLVKVRTRTASSGQQELSPIIVDIGRRLTLEEGERLAVHFPLDRAELGKLLAANPAQPLVVDVSAVVDPRLTRDGGVRPGSVGAIDHVRSIQTLNVPVTSENIDAWLDDLDNPDTAQQLRSLARLLQALADPAAEDTQARASQIADAIVRQWERFGPVQQAWITRFLPPAEHLPDSLRRIVDLAQRSDEPMVRVVFLAAQVKEAASPAMTAALRHKDPLIGEFARALRDSLQSGDE